MFDFFHTTVVLLMTDMHAKVSDFIVNHIVDVPCVTEDV